MYESTDMARIAHGLDSVGTINSNTLSIAFMEFLMDSDSNLMKSLWLSYGWEDISPLWGHEKKVPTFKDKPAMVKRWPEFQEAMTEVEADWYYISGHHASRFVADGESYGSGLDLYNGCPRAGFFNEPCHVGTWAEAEEDNPDKGRVPNEVFMWTSRDDWYYELGPADNPLYNAPHEDCRGLFLIGCNTLVYRATREMLCKYFPNAMIIGLISRECNSIARILKVVKGYGRDFFTDPGSIDVEELVRKLNPFVGYQDVIAVLRDGELAFMTVSKRVSFVDALSEVTKEDTL